MKVFKLIFCVGLLTLPVAAHGDVAKAPFLAVTVKANHPVALEHGPQVVLDLSITNRSKHATPGNEMLGRLYINDVEVKTPRPHATDAYFDIGPLKAGEKWRSDTEFGERDFCQVVRMFRRPGLYRIRWEVNGVRATPITVRVLPGTSLPGRKEPPANALLKAVRAQLPAGWEAFLVEGSPHYIRIFRDQPTLMQLETHPNASGESKPPQIRQFEIDLELCPYIAPADFPQVKARNEALFKKQEVLEKQLSRMPGIEFDKGGVECHSKSPRAKALFARYHSLEKAVVDLPECYRRNLSLNWSFHNMVYPEGNFEYTLVVDPTVRNECMLVTRRIATLFKRYEPLPVEIEVHRKSGPQ